jgi:type I restriction enzyme S subunit
MMTEIGEIPEEWRIQRLTELASITSGNTAPQDRKYFKNGLYPFIRVHHLNDLESGKYLKNFDLINHEAISELKLKVFKKDSIIFPKSGESIKLERRALLSRDSFVANHLAVIDTNGKNVNTLFLFYYLSSLRTSDFLSKTTMPSLNLSIIKQFPIPFPPLPEQQKIAEILSTADETIQKVNEEINLTEKLKKGLMQTLLTRGIGHTKFKMTEIGEIPEEWRNEKISKLGQIITGGTPSTSEPAYWNGEIPWIASGDVHQRYIKMARKSITQEGYLKSNCNLLPIGTVLIALNGQGKTRGLSAILDIEAVCNQSMAGIIPKRDILNSVYLLYHLLNRYAEIRNISGIGRNGLNLEHIGNIVISCPPLIEQEKIAEIISTIDNKMLLLGHKKERLERLKKGLMGDLLTGKVRVKINTSKGED